MRKALIALTFPLLLVACQTAPPVAELQNRNAELVSQLEQSQRQVAVLQRQEAQLQEQVRELERLADVLATEKSSRVTASTELRGQVRQFVQQQIDDLKAFLVRGELLDYIGSALVKRSYMDKEPLTLVDLGHHMPRSGSLTGVTGYFSAPTDLRLKVLRPVAEQYVVIWQSAVLSADAAGRATLELPVTVGVEPGDVVAYVFPEAVRVSYDRGTGQTLYTDDDLALGDTINPSSLSGEGEKRAYSLGVYAILE